MENIFGGIEDQDVGPSYFDKEERYPNKFMKENSENENVYNMQNKIILYVLYGFKYHHIV